MLEFEKIKLPYIFERQIAFSIPQENILLVFSYEGIHKINLESLLIETDKNNCENYSIFNTDKNELNYENEIHQMLGVYGGSPVFFDSYRNEIKLIPDINQLRILGSSRTCVGEMGSPIQGKPAPRL